MEECFDLVGRCTKPVLYSPRARKQGTLCIHRVDEGRMGREGGIKGDTISLIEKAHRRPFPGTPLPQA